MATSKERTKVRLERLELAMKKKYKNPEKPIELRAEYDRLLSQLNH